jgi:hypothetical protein
MGWLTGVSGFGKIIACFIQSNQALDPWPHIRKEVSPVAIITAPVNSELVLVLDNGIGASGQQLIRNRAYGDVKPDADHDDVYQVAQAILELQSRTVLGVQRKDTVELIDA